MTHDYHKNMSKKLNIVIQPSHVKTYRYVEKYMDKNIAAPEVTEIAKGIGLTPRQTYRIVDDLVALGVFQKEPFKKRGLRIVQSITYAIPS